MFQVVYELEKTWPEQGAMKLDLPSLVGEIHVSPESARQRAKGYLTCEVGMTFRPGEPTLVWGKRPVWRMPIHLRLRGYSQITLSGTIDVDAMTREVIPLTTNQIIALQDQADELATHLTPSADSAS